MNQTKHLFIINPVAGKGRQKKLEALVTRIQRACQGRYDYTIHWTTKAGDATTVSREAAQQTQQAGGQLRVYACGGDGTLNEVVNGVAGYPCVAVTNVPTGSGNDFLRMFGPRHLERFSNLSSLLEGSEATMDLIDCNGHLGLGIVCVGLDARVADDVRRYRRFPLFRGATSYLIALVLNVLFRPLSYPIHLTLGQHSTQEDFTLLCICNGRYYGGGFMPVGEAQPDDGVLNTLLIPRIGHLTFFKLVGKYAKGRYKECQDVIRDYHGQSIRFSSHREMVVVVDGEVLHGTDFSVSLSDKKLRFFYPADLNYHICGETTEYLVKG